TPALRAAVGAMVDLLEEARRDPLALCQQEPGADGATPWSTAAASARARLVRYSLELRMVVSTDR
ncbi:MAG: hypothetical protein ACKO04_11495, partial [Actinomycetes bacterium]